MNIDFSNGNLNLLTVQRHINLDITNASACDDSNNLLFVSNGSFIFNAADDTMQNGSGLNPSSYTTQYTNIGLTLPQANLVLPSITNSNQFILLHNTIDDYLTTGASFFLYYSVIDMSLNSGFGAVVLKNEVIHTDSMVPGRITACKHANGRDWWIVVHKLYSNELIEFLYTPSGFLGPWTKSLLTWRNINVGQCGFNPQGTKFAYYNADHGLDLADFDRCTGDFSNLLHIDMNDSVQVGGGLAFSPSGQYLYVSNPTHLYQFDTWATNVDSTKIELGPYDNFVDSVNGLPTAFWCMQLAPDNKIYMSSTNSVHYYHVINSPDSAGLAADLCQHCIQFPARNAFTIPNHPNYYLGADSGSICDTILTDITYPKADYSINVYPNPASSKLFFRINDSENVDEIIVSDLLGRLILTAKNTSVIDVSSINSGLYIATSTARGKKATCKIRIQH